MKRVDRVILEAREDKTVAELFMKEWNHEDELEYVKVGEINGDLEFAVGCFEIFVSENEAARLDEMIENAKKEVENLKNSKWNEEEAVRETQEYIEYLKEKKKEIENAEYVERLVIDYSKCILEIDYNGKKIAVDDDREILFKNMKIQIEKY